MQVAKVSRSIIGQQQVNSKDKVHQQTEEKVTNLLTTEEHCRVLQKKHNV